MTSGELAKRAQVNKETLRFYERRQLVRVPERTQSGYRSYVVEYLRRIQFIKRAQSVGFSLDEIRELLAMADTGEIDKTEVREFVTSKVKIMGQQIKSLRQLQKALSDLITECNNSEDTPECPIIESLSGS